MARSQILRVRKSRDRIYRPSREKRISHTEEMISEKKDLETGSSSTSNTTISTILMGRDVLHGGHIGRILAYLLI